MANKKQDSSKTKRIILRIIATILLVVGLVLIFNRQISDQMLAHNQKQALSSLSQKKIAHNQKKQGMFDFSKVKSVDFAQVTRSRVRNQADAIGAIAIPSVKMYLPVMLGMSDDAMATGGCTMRPDQKMGQGNYPLAGHYMTSKGILFSPLEDAKPGQKVYLTDLKRVYVYRIYLKKKVDPTAVWLVNNTQQKIVTLITCADGGVRRWAVRGNLVKVEKANKQNLQVFKLK
jgi:sortase A